MNTLPTELRGLVYGYVEAMCRSDINKAINHLQKSTAYPIPGYLIHDKRTNRLWAGGNAAAVSFPKKSVKLMRFWCLTCGNWYKPEFDGFVFQCYFCDDFDIMVDSEYLQCNKYGRWLKRIERRLLTFVGPICNLLHRWTGENYYQNLDGNLMLH